jgi:hypothetical protein
MRLARMHDLAGCRLIFDDEETLHSYRTKIHNLKVKHVLKKRSMATITSIKQNIMDIEAFMMSIFMFPYCHSWRTGVAF